MRPSGGPTDAAGGGGGGRARGDANGGGGGGGTPPAAAAVAVAAVAAAAPSSLTVSVDAAAVAPAAPASSAMACAAGGGAADNDGGDGVSSGPTRPAAAAAGVTPEMAAALSAASDYGFATRTRPVRFASAALVVARPDLALRPLGRCAWADVLLPLHNGVRLELSDIFDAVSSLQRRVATVRSAEFGILSTYLTAFASYATAALAASYELVPPPPPPPPDHTPAAGSAAPLFSRARRSAAAGDLHATLRAMLGVLRTAARRPPDEVLPPLVGALPGLAGTQQHLDTMAAAAAAAAVAAGYGADALPAARRRVAAALVRVGKFRRWHLLMVDRAARALEVGAAAEAAAAAAAAADAPEGGGQTRKEGRPRRGGGAGVSAGVWNKMMGGSYRRQYEVSHVKEIQRIIAVE